MAAAPVPATSATGKGVVEWGDCGQKWNCKKDEEAAHGLTGIAAYLPRLFFNVFTPGKEAPGPHHFGAPLNDRVTAFGHNVR
jgi:hypothetical protein